MPTTISSRFDISVLITTHNRQIDVIRAVESATLQSALPFEVIVVDDGSMPAIEDSTFSKCPKDVPVRIIRNPIALGASAARNIGILAARADWIAFLDDDDEFMPEKVASLTTAISQSQDTDVFYHPCVINMINERLEYRTRPGRQADSKLLYQSLLVKNIIGGTPMVAAKKTALISVGLFDEKLKALEDYDLWLRMAKSGHQFKFIDAILTRCHYTTRRKSITKSDAAGLGTFEAIENKHAVDFIALNSHQRTEHELWKQNNLIHRATLNLNYRETLRLTIRTAIRHPGIKQFAMALAAMLGPRFLIWIKAKISSSLPQQAPN